MSINRWKIDSSLLRHLYFLDFVKIKKEEDRSFFSLARDGHLYWFTINDFPEFTVNDMAPPGPPLASLTIGKINTFSRMSLRTLFSSMRIHLRDCTDKDKRSKHHNFLLRHRRILYISPKPIDRSHRLLGRPTRTVRDWFVHSNRLYFNNRDARITYVWQEVKFDPSFSCFLSTKLKKKYKNTKKNTKQEKKEIE